MERDGVYDKRQPLLKLNAADPASHAYHNEGAPGGARASPPQQRCATVAAVGCWGAAAAAASIVTLVLLWPSSLYSSATLAAHSLASCAGPWRAGGGDAAAPVRFLIVGDWGREGAYNQSAVAQQMGAVADRIRAQFIVSAGDNFYEEGLTGVNDSAFARSFSDVYTDPGLQVPWHAVLGNHDYYGDVLAQLDPALAARDKRFHVARSWRTAKPLCGALFRRCRHTLGLFAIDTTPMVAKYYKDVRVEGRPETLVEKDGHVMDWRGLPNGDYAARGRHVAQELEKALVAQQAASWKIVVGHHPVYSYGHHGDTLELIEHIQPLMESHGVDVFVNGHDHNMAHIKRNDSTVHYLTSGGGSKAFRPEHPPPGASDSVFFWEGQGFVAVEASAQLLKFDYYGLEGELMHSFQLTR